MIVKLSNVQINKFETATFKQELPEFIARARKEYPRTFEEVSDEYMKKFALSALEILQKFGIFNDFDKAYDLMINNAHGKIITDNPAAATYFKSIIRSEDMTIDQKVTLLTKNLSRYFGNA